jgi:alpha-galactosidase
MPLSLDFDRLGPLGFTGRQHVRDLWQQKNLPDVDTAKGVLPITIPAHGVMLYKLTLAR